MGMTALKGNPVTTSGTLPGIGAAVPDFVLVRQDLSEATLATFAGRKKVLNIFPSIDTGVCAASVRNFNKKAAGRADTVVLNISADLPFAQKRFCGAEGLEGVEMLSAFRSSFAVDYGVLIEDSPLKGLCARSVVVLDADGCVLYTQLVPEITQEPDYDGALAALG